MTLAIVRSLIVEIDQERYALPLAHVAETVRAEPEAIREINHRGVAQWRGDLIHVADGGAVLGTGAGASAPRRFYVVMAAGGKRRGLLVDRLVGHQDVVVKGLDPDARSPGRRVGHDDPGRRPGRLHPRRGPHSRRRPTCRLTTRATRDGLLGFADAMEARAAAEATPAPGPELHLLTFALDREEFGIPVTQVREVIRVVGDHPRAPGARRTSAGVANLRGRILAVVELRSRLGLAAGRAHPARARGGGRGPRPGARACWWMRSRR